MIIVIVAIIILGYLLNGISWLAIQNNLDDNIKIRNNLKLSDNDKNIAGWFITLSFAFPFVGIISFFIIWLVSVFIVVKNKL